MHYVAVFVIIVLNKTMEEQNFVAQPQPVPVPQPPPAHSHHVRMVIFSILISIILSVGASFLYMQWTLDQRDTDNEEKLAQMFANEKQVLNTKLLALDAEVLVLKEKFEDLDLKEEVPLLSSYETEFYKVSYPAGATVVPVSESLKWTSINLEGGRVEVWRQSDFPDGDRPFGFSGAETETEEELARYIPKEDVALGEEGNQTIVWLFHDVGREDLLETLKTIKDSVVLK